MSAAARLEALIRLGADYSTMNFDISLLTHGGLADLLLSVCAIPLPRLDRWISGTLVSTSLTPAHVDEDVGYILSRFERGPRVGVHSNRGTMLKDLPGIGMVAEDKKPRFVEFLEAGFSNAPVPFESVTDIAYRRLAQGYVGSLSIRIGCFDNSAVSNRVAADFDMTAHRPPVHSKKEIQTSNMVISWNRFNGGSVDDVKNVIATCVKLGADLGGPLEP